MNLIDFFCKGYAILRNYPHLPFWVITPFRRCVRFLSSKILPSYLSKGKILSPNIAKGVIVSLTSFPARIEYVWQVVECMLRQSKRPEKIILWLSREQYPDLGYLPKSLTERVCDSFEIRLMEGDLRSHKKYYYVLKEYPDCNLFIIDDDIYYPSDIIERSLSMQTKYPNHIVSNFGLGIIYDTEGKHLPYNEWPVLFNRGKDNDFFFGSGGGTLLTSSMLFSEATNIDLAIKLCPLADDVWLNAMARLKGTKTVFIPNGNFLPITIKNDTRLATVNNGLNKNDEQIKAVEKYFGRCFDKETFVD